MSIWDDVKSGAESIWDFLDPSAGSGHNSRDLGHYETCIDPVVGTSPDRPKIQVMPNGSEREWNIGAGWSPEGPPATDPAKMFPLSKEAARRR